MLKNRTSKKKCQNYHLHFFLSDVYVDSSTIEEEIVYMWFAHRGESNIPFAGIKTVEKSDATNIFEAITQILKTNLVIDETAWNKKLVGLFLTELHYSHLNTKMEGTRPWSFGGRERSCLDYVF